MSFIRNKENDFIFSNEYNLFSNKNWYNFCISQYNIYPDILKILPNRSMKTIFFNYEKCNELLCSVDYWCKLGEDFKEVPKNIKTTGDLTKYFSFGIDTPDDLEYDVSDIDDNGAYEYVWEDISLPPDWDSLKESLSAELDVKNIIKCIDMDGNSVDIKHDSCNIYLIDKKTFSGMPENIVKDINDDFVILLMHDAEYYHPYLIYNVQTETEKKIFNHILRIYKLSLVKKIVESPASISFIVMTPGGGFDTKEIEIADVIKNDENLLMHVNDDFEEVHKNTLEFIESKESGLLIYRGCPGSGKTSYIKYLTTLFQSKKFLFVSPDIMGRLSDPNFISFLSDNKEAIIILEDCEQLLVSRDNTLDSMYINSGLMNLLNMTDGILGSAFRFKFICTFNSDNISKIDNALLRKGRCKINYEFRKLSIDKIDKLIEKNKIKNPWNGNIKTEMTVAELYNSEDKDYQNKKQKRIGF